MVPIVVVAAIKIGVGSYLGWKAGGDVNNIIKKRKARKSQSPEVP